MKQFKGTPGPWVVSAHDRSIGPRSKDDDQSYGMILPVAWVEYDIDGEKQVANANLIAAAPELLEALQAIVSGTTAFNSALDVEHGFDGIAMIENARAAINKALGGE